MRRFWQTLVIVLVSGCTVNVGQQSAPTPSNSAPTTTQSSTSIASTAVAPLEAWDEFASKYIAFEKSELSEVNGQWFGLMASPKLRLYKFIGDGPMFEDITDTVEINFPEGDWDWDITIQSEQITLDNSVDFVVNYSPAPWHAADVENQGRDFGTVISGGGGTWRSLPMTEVYDPTSEHTAVEHIEFFNGGLFGDWYGSSGRGTLVYSWVGGKLEGVDATSSQIKSLPKLWCSVYEFKWTLPIKRCDKGQPVQMIQDSLNAIGYELIADGFFGNGTKFSIKYFQWSNELKITGEVDLETWKLLFKDVQLPGDDLDNNGVVTPEELSGG